MVGTVLGKTVVEDMALVKIVEGEVVGIPEVVVYILEEGIALRDILEVVEDTLVEDVLVEDIVVEDIVVEDILEEEFDGVDVGEEDIVEKKEEEEEEEDNLSQQNPLEMHSAADNAADLVAVEEESLCLGSEKSYLGF